MIEIQGLKEYEIDVRGVNIHVAEAGEGPMVVLIHGFQSQTANIPASGLIRPKETDLFL